MVAGSAPALTGSQVLWHHHLRHQVPRSAVHSDVLLTSQQRVADAVSGGVAQVIATLALLVVLLWRRRKNRVKTGGTLLRQILATSSRKYQTVWRREQAATSLAACKSSREANVEKRTTQSGFLQMLKDLTSDLCNDSRALPLFLFLVLSLFAGSAAAVALSYAQKDYITALANREASSFFAAIRCSLLGLAVALPATCAEEYSTSALALVWRDVMVQKLLGSLFDKRRLHWLRLRGNVRDPDARIAQDADHFVGGATLFLRDVLESLLRLMSFSIVVVRISPMLLVVMLLYAGLGTVVTVSFFGAPLVRLDRRAREQQQVLRRSLANCYDGAEGMALSGGERWEAQRASERYSDVSLTGWRRTRLRVFLAAFRDAWSWAAQLVPVVLLGPLYLSGWLDLGAVTQAATAFKVSLDALSIVVRKIRSVASISLEGQRLLVLRQELEVAGQEQGGNTIRHSGSTPHISVENLSLWRPGDSARTPLIKPLSLNLPSGMRLLVTGESGCGKTALLRAIAGLWAECVGEVDIAGRVMFLPQTPYHSMDSNLRQLLYFPSEEEHSDSEVLQALAAVGLHSLVERFGLDRSADWEAVISPGEQQRIAFARLLLHKPDIVLLDEATSSLDEDNEALLYSNLREINIPVVVSVGHRPLLHKYHTHLLSCVGDGHWDVSLLEESG
jgi:putative ATP-binding cassette transporter